MAKCANAALNSEIRMSGRELGGGVSLPWQPAMAALIGLSLLFTRITLGTDGNLAHAHHVIGSLVLTVVSISAAEVARPVRYLNMVLGAGLMAAPFMFAAGMAQGIRLCHALTVARAPC